VIDNRDRLFFSKLAHAMCEKSVYERERERDSKRARDRDTSDLHGDEESVRRRSNEANSTEELLASEVELKECVWVGFLKHFFCI